VRLNSFTAVSSPHDALFKRGAWAERVITAQSLEEVLG
jgi:hypothetical protein